MYLKSLEIHGFKSFADKITIEFGEGITSIVGPNGSGKSNISDAVRWVMGEQSVKSLRGSKMEDVIFAGTQSRKPLGFAEVSLTIDNSDMALPIECSEVTVTRRVYRSGESEYFINKSMCRLKDIHELFMDTGLGKDGYSIIGQGKIDEILSTKSEDRRLIFEEAAGITKYRYRKEEAGKKLELTQENLTRLKDIINELEMQIGPLQQQSEKARKYLDLREELKVLEVNVFLDLIERLKKSLDEVTEQYENINSQLRQDEMLLQTMENDLEHLYHQAKDCDTSIEQIRNMIHENKTNQEKAKNDINLLENNIKYNLELMDKINTEIYNIINKISMLDDEIHEKQVVIEELKTFYKCLKDNIQELEKRNQTIMDAIEAENNDIEALKSEIIEKMNKVSELKVKQNSLKVLENNFLSRKEIINNEITTKKGQLIELNNRIMNLKEECNQKQKEILCKKDALNELRSSRVQVHNQYENLNAEKNRLISLYKEKSSKKTLLEEMEKDYEGYSKSVKSILLEWQNGELKHLNIHGPVSQLIRVPQKYVTAIEIALGAAMQNIVVDSEQDAKSAIEFLKRGHLGRATFLPISSVHGKILDDPNDRIKSFPGYLGIASELVSYDPLYSGIINSVLGRVVVVENIDVGISMAKKFGYQFRIVTLEGDVLNPGGSLSGGSINKVSSFLSRANEIEALDKESRQIQKTVTEVSSEIETTLSKLKDIDNKITVEEQCLKEMEGMIIKAESDLKHNMSLKENTETELQTLTNEEIQIDEQIRDLRNEIAFIIEDIIQLEKTVKSTEQLVMDKQASYKNVLETKEKLSEEVMEKKMQLNSMAKDLDLYTERIAAFEKEKQELLQNKTQKEEEGKFLQEKNVAMNAQISKKKQIIKCLEEKANTLDAELQKKLDIKKETESNIGQCQLDIKQQRERILVTQEEHRRLENKKTRIELELENSINKLWEEYELTFTTASEYKKDIGNILQAQKRINHIKNEIKALGNINIDAIEEYKNVKERLEFLNAQRNDLEEAKASLIKIIDDMVALMKKQFAEQFKIINTCFNEVFVELFGGGKAELKLTSPENILESGVEIEVQPPGKKLQNLMLLSGGEKAFTAIALLFAILKVRPTPFCILDEIEAALDDVNVYRFAQYLKQFSKKTQFIIVTHRRGTMEAADVLYGVTMQEQGVSKLLSLKIDEVAS